MTRKDVTLTFTVPIPSAGDVGRMAVAVPSMVWRTLLIWQTRADTRAQLAALDERLRRDIGLSWEDVRVEAAKPFWQA